MILLALFGELYIDMGEFDKRGWLGLNYCILCKLHGEYDKHLFVQCTFCKSIWFEIKHALQISQVWGTERIEENSDIGL